MKQPRMNRGERSSVKRALLSISEKGSPYLSINQLAINFYMGYNRANRKQKVRTNALSNRL